MVGRKRRRRLPHRDSDHRQSLLARLIEDQPRDALDSRIAVDDEDRLAELLERRHQRIVVAQDHLVIELAIDPALDDPLDVAEVADHVAVVERAGPHLDLRRRVVAVRVLADAVVVEQPMAVAEVDFLRDRVHGLQSIRGVLLSRTDGRRSCVDFRAASTARCCWRRKRGRRGSSPLRQRRARVGGSRAAHASQHLLDAASSRTPAPLVRPWTSHARRLSADPLGHRGTPPAYDTPDEDVYLPGRNLVLLTKAGVLAASRELSRIALGPLAGNPFPDATPDFFDADGAALSLGLDHPIEIARRSSRCTKQDVIRLGEPLGVPLDSRFPA